MAQINVSAYNDSGNNHTFAFRDGNTMASLGTFSIPDGGSKVLLIDSNEDQGENFGKGRLGYRKADPGAPLPGWSTTDWINDGDTIAVG